MPDNDLNMLQEDSKDRRDYSYLLKVFTSQLVHLRTDFRDDIAELKNNIVELKKDLIPSSTINLQFQNLEKSIEEVKKNTNGLNGIKVDVENIKKQQEICSKIGIVEKVKTHDRIIWYIIAGILLQIIILVLKKL